ncbi:MAG: cytochrome c [Betaproteobacteria bacterium]|nr:cytochrome c [Betaproteobacteria bacterium]
MREIAAAAPMRRRLSRAAGALLCLFATAAVAATTDEQRKSVKEQVPVFDKAYLSNKANIEVGRKVWEAQCRHCHGAAAYPGKAPKLSPGPMTPDVIYDRVTFGFGKMPAWKDVFTDEQRKSVVAYMKSRTFSP